MNGIYTVRIAEPKAGKIMPGDLTTRSPGLKHVLIFEVRAKVIFVG